MSARIHGRYRKLEDLEVDINQINWNKHTEYVFSFYFVIWSGHTPEFRPEPGVRALEVGVHLHVVLEVLEHLCLEPDVPVLDDDHPLNMNHSQYCVCKL